MIPTYFAALVCLSGLAARAAGALPWLLFWSLFGASAAFALPALGGASISPAVAFLPFVIVASLRDHGASKWISGCSDGEPGFWLLLAVTWGVVGAIFLPRLFAGEVDVLTTDRLAVEGGTSLRLAPLRPVSTNISQSAYAVGGLLCFLSARALCRAPAGFQRFTTGVLVLCGANIAAALINIGELYLGLPRVLEFVRNGGYAMLSQSGISGLQRIHGTFPEASSFAGFTLPLFAYTFTMWRSGVQAALSGSLALSLLVLLLISTSSTAYVGLAIYFVALAVLAIWAVLTGAVDRSLPLLLGIIGLLIAAVAMLGIFAPGVFRPVGNFFDITLFGKLDSSSGMERGSWNAQAWLNFVETRGAGVGLGSARASSLPLVLLSNMGAAGSALFALFVVAVYLHRQATDLGVEVVAAIRAARHALFATLIVASISAAVFDLGMAFYAFAAIACGLAPRRHARVITA